MRPLFRPSRNTIAALYGAIVAQARQPVFYEAAGVPDTVLGRFDMILLHLVLLLRRLRAGGAGAFPGKAGAGFAQELQPDKAAAELA
jgi:hypothetical protein